MKLRLPAGLAALAILACGISPAQYVNGRFTTSMYTFSRFDTAGSSRTYLRAFQSVQLYASQGDFSLATSLMGAVNGTNQFGDNGNVRFYNLYLRWANIGRMVDVNLGRQAVYAGVGSGTIDGITARARLMSDAVTVSGFGGTTVDDQFTGVRKNWHDNLSLGGQVLTTLVPNARIGLSYMYRREERDPYTTLRESGLNDSAGTIVTVPRIVQSFSEAEQLGGADAFWSYGRTLEVYGRYDYDFNEMQTSRGLGSVRVNVTGNVALTGDYAYRRPQIAYNSIFSVFTFNSTQQYEGGVEYGFTPLLRAFGKVGTVSYSDTSSMTWSVGLNSGYGSVAYAGGTGYAGQLASLSLQAAYPVLEGMLIPDLGFSWASYRLSAQDPKNYAVAIAAGATVRPLRTFSVDVQGQWLSNRLYANDTRLQVRLLYWFAQRLSLFSGEVHP